MENQRYQIELLIFLQKLGLRFNLTQTHVAEPIQVLGKFSPAEFTDRDFHITTEDIDE